MIDSGPQRPLDLDPIRARLEKTTPGPWHMCKDDNGLYIRLYEGEFDPMLVDSMMGPEFTKKENAEFCAHARRDVPDLTDEVERLRKWALKLEVALGQIVGHADITAEMAKIVASEALAEQSPVPQ